MAIETYSRKPRGQKHQIVKYRVRIRTTVESTHDPDQRIPVNIDELYDTLAEAKRAEERHWLSIRTGALSVELSNQVKRLAEPAMRDLLETYHARTKQYRSASARESERVRLETTIARVLVNLGKRGVERVRPGTEIVDGRAPFGQVLVVECDKAIIKSWISRRKMEVGAATVNRELGMISSAMDRFRDYWPEHEPIENPCKLLHKEERPKLPQHRERVLSEDEEKTLLAQADKLRNTYLALAIRVALGTAMRRGDILSLDWSHINWQIGTISIPEDKATNAGNRRTGRKAIMLPIAFDALATAWTATNKPKEGKVFGVTMLTFRSAWVRLQKKLATDHGITNLKFHDLRHTVITRAAGSGWSSIQVKNAFDIGDLEHLVKRFYKDKAAESAAKALREGRSLTLEELAAIGGHADKGMVARYANLTPEDLARPDERKAATTGDVGKIVIKQDGDEYVAIIGNMEARAASAKAAVQMARELAEAIAG